MDRQIQEFLDAMKEKKEYDYICNHGHEFSNMTLCNILKEYIYGVHEAEGADEILAGIADEIESQYED